MPAKRDVGKRTVKFGGRITSVSLEDEFWSVVKEIAAARQVTLGELISIVDAERAPGVNLSSAVRLYVLSHVRAQQMG